MLNFYGSFPHRILHKNVGRWKDVLHGHVHLWFYANYAL